MLYCTVLYVLDFRLAGGGAGGGELLQSQKVHFYLPENKQQEQAAVQC